ncbi:hypothetical protein PROFUN_08070 [Planoprotostelium fungivorum]|uniref:Uncharacterized protein n=1 Tax=Planoprotostelium fungivorum TaxID=1890364 RepID=A0A2P6NKI7_9EUKA|nr:hypothetical protein PROFUN_08070 [Planoprotostelium fungivorum]
MNSSGSGTTSLVGRKSRHHSVYLYFQFVPSQKISSLSVYVRLTPGSRDADKDAGTATAARLPREIANSCDISVLCCHVSYRLSRNTFTDRQKRFTAKCV